VTRRAVPFALAGLALALAPACISPSVVDSTGRGVQLEPAALDWRPAGPEALDGFFESISIEGEAAAALVRIYYHFAPSGSYTGAALVIGGAEPEFQTLSGQWKLGPDGLDLGDGVPVRLLATPEHLRLESEGGVVTLRKRALE
jgi:hypothetical protein